MYACMYVCVGMYVCVCMYVCMCVCVCMYAYTYVFMYIRMYSEKYEKLLVSHRASPQVADRGTLTSYGGYRENKIPGVDQN
jgi:hypothetical protein